MSMDEGGAPLAQWQPGTGGTELPLDEALRRLHKTVLVLEEGAGPQGAVGGALNFAADAEPGLGVRAILPAGPAEAFGAATFRARLRAPMGHRERRG